MFLSFFFFFFQAEDGIRDRDVTGVQTCALPICGGRAPEPSPLPPTELGVPGGAVAVAPRRRRVAGPARSEERRVGKECRSRWAAEQDKKKKKMRGRRRRWSAK